MCFRSALDDNTVTTTLTVERDGLYDVTVHKLLKEEDLSPETVFTIFILHFGGIIRSFFGDLKIFSMHVASEEFASNIYLYLATSKDFVKNILPSVCKY